MAVTSNNFYDHGATRATNHSNAGGAGAGGA